MPDRPRRPNRPDQPESPPCLGTRIRGPPPPNDSGPLPDPDGPVAHDAPASRPVLVPRDASGPRSPTTIALSSRRTLRSSPPEIPHSVPASCVTPACPRRSTSAAPTYGRLVPTTPGCRYHSLPAPPAVLRPSSRRAAVPPAAPAPHPAATHNPPAPGAGPSGPPRRRPDPRQRPTPPNPRRQGFRS